MNEQKAREILGDMVHADETLFGGTCCRTEWSDGDLARLDGEYYADELEAIAWWIRNKGEK